MTDLIGIPPVSIAFADLMLLTSPPVSRQIYDDVKLLIEELNQYAEPEKYAVIIACIKNFKKDVDRIVYIRCDREEKAKLNPASFERRLYSDTRLIKCSFSIIDKQNKKND